MVLAAEDREEEWSPETAIAVLEGVLERLRAEDGPARLRLRPYTGTAAVRPGRHGPVRAAYAPLPPRSRVLGRLRDRCAVVASDYARRAESARSYGDAVKATRAVRESRGLGEALDQARRLTADLGRLSRFSGAEEYAWADERASRILGEFEEACSVFYDADLSGVDLGGAVPEGGRLEGVRWNTGTRWPAGYEERIRRISRVIAPGVYEIRRDRQD